MKFTISAITLCVILSTDKIISKAESVNFAMAGTEVKNEVKAYEDKNEEPEEEIDWEERSRRLKEKLNVMADRRMKLWTRGGHVVKSTKECRPHGPEAEDKKGSDVGLLGCDSSGDICIKDSSSSLGGVCAHAVISEGGYGDETKRYEHEERAVSSQYAEASMLMHLPESAVNDILQSAKDAGAIGEECVPGTNEGYVEVGVLNPCKNSDHVCLKDASSSLGGNCVDVGRDEEQVLWGSWIPNLNKNKQTCTFEDGTSGFKCDSGSRMFSACDGLSSDFIRNNIGCGSCNKWWVCSNVQAGSFIGERSCNQMGACNHLTTGSHVGHGSCTGFSFFGGGRLSVGDGSCQEPFSCSSLKGDVTIGSDSCTGSYACKGALQNLTPVRTIIGSGSCNKDGACSFLSGTTTIGNGSCNHCYSCSHSYQVTTIQDESCNAPFACAYALGNTDIRSNSCIGSGACEFLGGISIIGERSCLGVGACKLKKSMLPFIQLSELKVGDDACLGCYACNTISGRVSISSRSCYGFASCRNLVSIVSIGKDSCQEIKTCSENKDSSIVTIGDNACNTVNNCNHFSGRVTISNNECSRGSSSDICRLPSLDDYSKDISSRPDSKLRGGANISNIGCLPNVQKVKLQHLGVAKSMQGFELQVIASGVNVAERKTVMKSDVSWEVDLKDTFPVDSVSVLNSWCNESPDPEKCLCNLTGATLLLIDGSGEEIASVLAGDTCGQETVEFVFDAWPEFCKSTEHLVQPGLAPTRWNKRSRALGSAPKKCSG